MGTGGSRFSGARGGKSGKSRASNKDTPEEAAAFAAHRASAMSDKELAKKGNAYAWSMKLNAQKNVANRIATLNAYKAEAAGRGINTSKWGGR
ncbi:MAG: hypothetical protein PHQ03_07350 [Methylococcales bacterium]|nr:hypothetical protein [Methylococcales bacterium]